MKRRLPGFRKKQKAKKKKGYASAYLIIDGGGALVIGVTFLFFPEPIITTSIGLAWGLFAAGYKHIKNRGKKKQQEKILSEIRKIKYGVYAILLAALIGAVCVIIIKVSGMTAETIDNLATHIKLLWTIVLVIILFICFVALGRVASEEKGVERNSKP